MKVTDSLGNFMTVEDVLRKDFENVMRKSQTNTSRDVDGAYSNGAVEARWQCYFRGAREALSIQEKVGK